MPVTATKRPAATAKPNTKHTKTPISRRKNCFFCLNKETDPDYKDTAKLRRYISERGRIIALAKTRTCAKHQRAITTAIKRARTMALFA
jgi:small subunit ribosomal protein S18